MKTTLKMATAVGMIAASTPHYAYAQDQAGDDFANSNVIVVTAQKRSENIQDVPLSIVAIGGDALESRSIDSFEQLQYVAPGLNFNAGINARQSASTIRGIGTSLFNIGVEGSTAIVIDGVVMGREGAGIFDLSDVERVEILRGPQGTLFGKNASAGVISIVTRNPTDELAINASLSYGSFNEVNLSGGISGPIAPGISARLSGYFNDRDGYITNVNPTAQQQKLNDRHEFGIRGKIAIEAGSNVDVLLGADFTRRDQNSGAPTLRSASTGGPGLGFLGFGPPLIGGASAALGIVPGPNNREIGSEGSFIDVAETYGGFINTAVGVGDHDLVFLSSYREWTSFDNNDADLVPLTFLSTNDGDLQQSQFSQEIRLVSPSSNRLTYTLGLFYFEQDINQDNIQAGSFGLIAGGAPLGTRLLSNFKEKNYAIFGQGEFRVTEKLSLIGGIRVLRSEVEAAQSRTVAPGSVAAYIGQAVTTQPLVAEDKDGAVVWRAGLKYDLSDDVNVFLTASQGYKATGIATGFTSAATVIGGNQLPTVRPEVPLQFEAGVRSVMLDGRLTANFTGYYTRVKNFQSQALVIGPAGTPVFSVANAGRVESYGLEADLTLVPVDGLTLSTALAYTNARFDSFDNAQCYTFQASGPNDCVDVDGNGRQSGGDFQDLAGGRLAASPDWVINSLVRYEAGPVGPVEPFVQIGMQYRSDAQSSNLGDPRLILDDRFLVDLQAGMSFMDGTATATFFVRNLTKEDFVESIFNAAFDTGGLAQFRSFEAERTFGIRLNLNY